MTGSDFEGDLKIDPNALDIACLRQPETFYKWAQRSIEARGKADRLKLRQEVLEAELELKCRKDPESFGLEKVTEGAITSAVTVHPDLIKAKKKHLAARDDAAMLHEAAQAMEMKKRMLELLVTLHGQSYFAGPSTPRDLAKVWAAQNKDSEARVNGKMKLRKREPK